MLRRLLHRSIAAVDQRLVLLAPSDAQIPSAFESIDGNAPRHTRLLQSLQRLRGSVYLRDGAIQPHQLSVDGLHQTPEDEKAWHLLMVDKLDRVDACIWYLEHPTNISVERLRVRNCPLAKEPASKRRLWNAVETEISRARDARLGYAELGGWAVAAPTGGKTEGLILALAAFSLGQVLGGALGITTATVRHCSSTILRRLGGSDLFDGDQAIPSYYDPRYKCEMELLRFDSRRPNDKYKGLVEMLRAKFAEVSVISQVSVPAAQPGFAVLGSIAAIPRTIVATT
jgi:hypothetical protein